MWQKQGLIYAPSGANGWDHNSVMTPTPFLFDEKMIRIFCGFRDKKGVSRLGYIDVDAQDPSRVIKVSKKPILDIGQPGTFDDNGLILGEVLRVGSDIWMYYVGFQLVNKVKFLAFTGLAISTDNGESFGRYSSAPVLDRNDGSAHLRTIHSVEKSDDLWRFWYTQGDGWEYIDDVPYPRYHIRYVESKDGVHFDTDTDRSLILPGDNEYRIGRPRVTKFADSQYEMFYTFDTLNKDYRAGYAQSQNGVDWTRCDHMFVLPTSESGWDSEMVCYPSYLETPYNTYLFYSGNNMGATGVGFCVLDK
jgi:predicted GH43/DUF377 family glycosyl hydrolase